MFALIDCNNFFVSCEKIFRPDLEGRPVIVLSSNDGCVVSRSNEAKKLGIPMGAPAFKYTGLFRGEDVKVFSSNFMLYNDISHRVMKILHSFSPDVECYSVDEAFLGLKHLPPEKYNAVGNDMQQTIKKWTGIPITVGIAPTKTLSKVATHYGKKFSGQSVVNFAEIDNLDEVLGNLDVGDVWGIGRRLNAFLKSRNINTAYDLKSADISWIRGEKGVALQRTVLELNGYPCLELEHGTVNKKSMICSRSFAGLITTKKEMESAVGEYISRAGEKLRKQNSVTSHLTVYIQTDRHKSYPQHTGALSAVLEPPTSDTRKLTKAAMHLLGLIFKPGYRYKKAGVILNDIVDKDYVQLGFAYPDLGEELECESRFMENIDRINSKYGKDTLRLGMVQKNSARTKHDDVSPAYTTNWDDVALVK